MIMTYPQARMRAFSRTFGASSPWPWTSPSSGPRYSESGQRLRIATGPPGMLICGDLSFLSRPKWSDFRRGGSGKSLTADEN